MIELALHPRLYIGPREIARLRGKLSLPLLRRAASKLEADAKDFMRSATFDWTLNTHNAHLVRARILQGRVITLLVQWLRKNDPACREAAVAHLREMARWEYWSWITWRENNPAPDATWDLSYGENAATLAIAFDLLHDTLTADERELLIGMARRWITGPFLKHTEPGQEDWWYNRHNSNWLAVCAGGAGMAALSMFEHLPEAPLILERANIGVTNFMASLAKSGGGWTEGVIYWNYGMRYAFLFLLSHEQATGQKHPAFLMPETLETLRFPPDFAPHGQTCAFGDLCDHPWQPVALHYGAARRLNAQDVLRELDAQPHKEFEETWATVPELLALHPGTTSRLKSAAKGPRVKLYPGLRWGFLADRLPAPRFYVAVRGGTTADPHNSPDLLSWHCLVNGERLVANVSNREYIDTTFSDRRFELPEIRPDTKNTILIGGVGMAQPGEAETSIVTVAGRKGIRLDATSAFRISSHGGNMALFVGRLFLLLDAKTLLILDRVELRHTNRIETRLHTYAALKASAAGARIKGKKAALNIALTATAPCKVSVSQTTPTNPDDPPARVLRWATKNLHDAVTFATLLTAGQQRGSVALETEAGIIQATLRIGRKKHVLVLDARLLPNTGN